MTKKHSVLVRIKMSLECVEDASVAMCDSLRSCLDEKE